MDGPLMGLSTAPEHDWAVAAQRLFPVLRPAGTHCTPLAELAPDDIAREGMRGIATPVCDAGPVDLVVAFALRSPEFDVLVNADHLLTWGVTPAEVRDTAMANLARWSATAPWTDEAADGRRVLSSDTSEGSDAARILLPEVRRYLRTELGADARVLVAVPDQDLLVAGSVRGDDPTFAGLFCGFCAELTAGSDDPVDERVFELVDDELVVFRG